ncbi:MAG TPA: FHA domain-containing protein [Isosphaeraceae bacterium]|jgi:pilus assembly protein CpaF|nr:FHA domain-containing protein [Isosphaeraceae bacterium]
MAYQLVVLKGRSGSKVLRLAAGVTTVGRQQDCQLRIGSAQVSRKHCQLVDKGPELVLVDLGSSNGTFVNGKKVIGQLLLKPGDVLSFGKVKFRVEKLGAPGTPADTAVAEEAVMEDSGDDVEFEIDFDEEGDQDTAITSTPPAITSAPPAAAAPSKKPDAAPQKGKAAPQPAEMGDEAVADFLLNIDLDEEDKR